MFTIEDAVFVFSVLLVAVTVTVVLAPVGAVKFPFASIVPAPVAPPPATDQVTPAGSPVAVNCVVCPLPIAVLAGETVIAGEEFPPHPEAMMNTKTTKRHPTQISKFVLLDIRYHSVARDLPEAEAIDF